MASQNQPSQLAKLSKRDLIGIAQDNGFGADNSWSMESLRALVVDLLAPDPAPPVEAPTAALPPRCIGTIDRVHCVYMGPNGCQISCGPLAVNSQ